MQPAASVGVGHYLLSATGPTRVRSVLYQELVGVFAPLTSSGTLLVDGLLASCYADVGSHRMAHVAALPVRTFPRLLEVEVGLVGSIQ